MLATSSVSQEPSVVELEAIPVLYAFRLRATPREALLSLKDRWELDETAFQSVVQKLISLNYLVPAENESDYPSQVLLGTGFGSPVSHLGMLSDVTRVMTYKQAIDRHVSGKSVAEIGCGTGILSILAARAGAERVIAIEETAIAHLAEQLFAVNGFSDRIQLIRGNSLDVQIGARVDVLIHELIGNEPLTERMLDYVRDAIERFLRVDGMVIPHRLQICCVGLEDNPLKNFDRAAAIDGAVELQSIYGLDLSPLIESLRVSPSECFLRPIGQEQDFRILSDECVVWDLDLTVDAPVPESTSAVLRIREAGTLGAVSIFFRAHMDKNIRLSNSPFGPQTHWLRSVTPLSKRIPVKSLQTIEVVGRIRSQDGMQRCTVDLAEAAES